MSDPTFRNILCADWGLEARKRAVYVADVADRCVYRAPPRSWTALSVLDYEGTLPGPTLVTFDAPIGVPTSFLEACSRGGLVRPGETFIELLRATRGIPDFFTPGKEAAGWQVARPFFAVPPGKGSFDAFRITASRAGVAFRREVERATLGNPVFVTSGIPGSVGSGAVALWLELRELVEQADRSFRVWPFEGSLEEAATRAGTVVGEIYPRAAYAIALGNEPLQRYARLNVAKTSAPVRERAIQALRSSDWVAARGVHLEDLDAACASEDDFDACVTAAALLRCALAGLNLNPPEAPFVDGIAEGGILGTEAIDFTKKMKMF